MILGYRHIDKIQTYAIRRQPTQQERKAGKRKRRKKRKGERRKEDGKM